MKIKQRAFLPIILISLSTLFSFSMGSDLVVKVIKDDLINAHQCTLGVLKNGSFKNMDKKYTIVSYDFYLLNYRGETKWYKQLKGAEIDLDKYPNVEITKGDLIVIDNIVIASLRTGETTEIKRITERYLIK